MDDHKEPRVTEQAAHIRASKQIRDAFENGAVIQSRSPGWDWEDDAQPDWTERNVQWRIKPDTSAALTRQAAPEAPTLTYTVNGTVMSQLEYISYLHDRLMISAPTTTASTIKTWRERLEESIGVQPAMHYADAEIADLRAALAQQGASQEAQAAHAGADQLLELFADQIIAEADATGWGMKDDEPFVDFVREVIERATHSKEVRAAIATSEQKGPQA